MSTEIIVSITTFVIGITTAWLVFHLLGANKKLKRNEKIWRWTLIVISLLAGIGYFIYIYN